MTRVERERLEGHVRSLRFNELQWRSWGERWDACADTARALRLKAEQRLEDAHATHQ